MSEGPARWRRMRRRTLRRWALPSLAGVGLIASLAVVVRRGEEARRLSNELSRLQAEQEIARDRLAEAMARVDSLGSLGRLERAAGALGLRQAREGEVVYLADAGPADGLARADEAGRRDGTRQGGAEAER